MSLSSQFAAQLLQECPWPVNIFYWPAYDHGVSHVSVEHQTYWTWGFPKAISQVGLSVNVWVRHRHQEKPQNFIKIEREVILIWAILHCHQHHEYQKVIIKLPLEGNSALMLSCVMGKQFPLFSSLSCMYIHRQTYPRTFVSTIHISIETSMKIWDCSHCQYKSMEAMVT